MRVVDGDTVVVDVDLGFRLRQEMVVRLAGIDAPETRAAGPEGEAAAEHLRSLLPVGSTVFARTEKPRDRYGRWLAWLRRTPFGVSVNSAMVEAGHARWYGDPPA